MTQLTKSAERKIAGVCGGLAAHWNTDPLWVRVAAGVCIFVPPLTIPVLVGYAILAWLLPEPGRT